MRSRVPLLVFGLTLLTVLPHVVFGALTPLSGGWSIIPAACNCPPSGSVGGGGLTTGYAGWGCVIQVAQNLVNFGVSLGVLVGVLVLAYAGFLWVLNPVSPENRSTARAILLNAVIGLVITLAAWLLINTLLTVLGTSVAKTTGVLTTSTGDKGGCDYGAPDQGNVAQTTPGTDPTSPQNQQAIQDLLQSSGVGACDASTLQQDSGTGQYALTASEAQTLSCIASPESNCGAANLNYNWGNGSSAAGAFQVTMQGNYKAYNNPACDAAAGLPAGTPLNCNQGFKGGNPLGNQYSQQCTQAASNLACSTQAAAYMVNTQGFSAWTADPHSQKQQQCIGG